MAGNAPALLKWLTALGVAPQEICLIALTHGHFDHGGCADALRAATGGKIALGRADAERMLGGALPSPGGTNGWGHFLSAALGAVSRAMPGAGQSLWKPDLIVGEEGLSLAEYGIAGRLVPTPGHTTGSLSVLLDDGRALVGDLAMNGLPFTLRPALAVLGDDLALMRASARRLLDLGAQVIYPAHGKPFSAEALRRPVSDVHS